MIRLSEIEEFFNSYDFNDKKIDLSECEKIVNLEKFIDSHIKILKGKKQNSIYRPYYDRLQKIYLKLKNENNRKRVNIRKD